MEGLGKYLAGHSFFEKMDRKHIDFLEDCASNARVDEGEYICREGDPAEKFFLIRHGKIAVEAHRPRKGSVIIQTLGPGDVVGWSWVFPPYEYHFDARAVELTRIVALDAKCMRNKFDLDFEFGFYMMRRLVEVIADRLQATRIQLLDVYGEKG